MDTKLFFKIFDKKTRDSVKTQIEAKTTIQNSFVKT